MKRAHFFASRQGPPSFLGETDPVFASDNTLPCEDLPEQIVQRRVSALFAAAFFEVNHDIDVNVAIPGMTEARDRQAAPALQFGRKLKQRLELAARYDDIFVQLGQAGVAQRV